MEWKVAEGRHASGRDLFLGKIRVGWAGYSATGSKTDPDKYAASSTLPGLKPISGRFMTQEEAERRVEAYVRSWISYSGLTPPQPSSTPNT